DTRIIFTRAQNLYAWEISSGLTIQLTNFQSVPATPAASVAQGPARGGQGGQPPFANRGARNTVTGNTQEKWLQEESLENSMILQSRKAKREKDDSMRKLFTEKALRTINIDDRNVAGSSLSNDGRFISYRLTRTATGTKSTIVPSYV